MFEYALLAGLIFGLYYSLIGIGLNLVFGVLRMVNLAHGDFVMLGGFAAYFAYTLAGWNPLVALVIAFVIFLALGFGLYFVLVPRLSASRDPEMISLVLFFGLSQVIEALATIFFGNDQHSIFAPVFGSRPVQLLGQSYPIAWIVTGAVSVIAIAGLYVYLNHTRLGYATRAVMASREEALVSGISVHRVSAIAFGLGIALAAVAGVLAPFMLGGITPSIGVGITVTAFAVIVLGSLGNPLGTVAGGLIFGVSLMLMQTYLTSWANLLPYVLLLLVLLTRPNGIFGRGTRYA